MRTTKALHTKASAAHARLDRSPSPKECRHGAELRACASTSGTSAKSATRIAEFYSMQQLLAQGRKLTRPVSLDRGLPATWSRRAAARMPFL
jgi:hypothetical protein